MAAHEAAQHLIVPGHLGRSRSASECLARAGCRMAGCAQSLVPKIPADSGECTRRYRASKPPDSPSQSKRIGIRRTR